jgi:RND family efflux transporter MFP subunit
MQLPFRLSYHTFLVLLAAMVLYSCREEFNTVKPEIRTVTESVYASGRIKAEGQYKVFASVSGLLHSVLVERGQAVEKGTPLFLIRNDAPTLNAENARLALELAKENYQGGAARKRELEVLIAQAEKKLSLDSIQHLRQAALWENKVGTQQELDLKKLTYQSSSSQLQALRSQLEQLQTTLENEWKRAQNNYRISLNSKGDYTVRSEIKGVVFDILKEPGELIGPQEHLAVIGDAERFYLELQIDEYDIVKVMIGQKVLVNMDSYKGQTFSATVSRIHPIMDSRSRSFTVEARFDSLPGVLYPNLTAEANIILRVKENAVTIPNSYLTEGNQVLVGPEEKRAVVIGIADLQRTEILSGLDTSDILYQPR